ncbi:MAG TPA: hypothetical protein VFT42_03160 [Solirubrobacteraceae bacterium]|nr:hypothetical protein [Solirubrobacteraceae bacterium]
MRSWTSQTGQSTVEYAAVVLLVCALLAGLFAVPVDGRPVAGAVDHQLAYALCVVTRGDCEEDRQPCPTRTDDQRLGATFDVLFLHAGRHHALIREDRSDGTVALTLLRDDEGGAQAGTGLKAALRWGSKELALGGELSAAVLAKAGAGSTWVLPRAQADELQRRLQTHLRAAPATDLLPGALVRRLLPGLPPPAQTFGEAGVSASLGVSGGGDGVSGSLGLSGGESFGSRVDHGSGRRTFYVKVDGKLSGALRVSAVGAEGSGEGQVEYAVTVDRDGVPLDLEVVETGTLDGSLKLPKRLRPVADRLRVPSHGTRTWVSESHLDLTDSASRDVAARFIAAVRTPRPRLGPAVQVSGALSRLLAERAVVNVRSYDVGSSGHGLTLSGKVEGIGLGVDAGESRRTSRLVGAATRGIDGQWRTRGDCLAAV